MTTVTPEFEAANPQRTHGLQSTWRRGCRCTPCENAHQAYLKERRVGKGWSGSQGTPPPPRIPKRAPDIPMEWKARRACAGLDVNIFFPAWKSDEHVAKGICDACPVSQDCLTYAIAAREPDGIWGGLNYNERMRYRRRIRKHQQRSSVSA